MRAGWEIKRLGDICGFQNGFAFKSNLFKANGYPILRISNIQDEVIETRRVVYFQPEDYKENFDRYRVFKGDLLIAMSGATTGKIGFNTTEQLYFLNQRVGKFEPKGCLLKKYLFYFLSTRVADNLRIAAGAAQPNLSTEQIKDFEIPIPPLPEQQRIVALLDEAFAAIATAKANAEKNLKNARALFDSYLNAIFSQRGEGWVERTVDELSLNLDSKRIPITKSDRKSGEYPYYGASGIVDYVDDYIFDGDTLLVSEDGANLLARSTPIAFSVSGKYWVNNHAHILKFEDMATQRFVEYYFGSIRIDEYITGAAQPKLNQKALNSIPIFIPKSVEEQANIVDGIEMLSTETKHLESIYQKKITALDELKKSILHQAFTGEL
jgi:type I restriction enzyme, S subunit